MNQNVIITTSSFAKVNETVVDPLVEKNIAYHINPHGQKVSTEQLIELIEKFQPIGVIAGTEKYTREVFEKATNLKTISRVGVGTDGIDFDMAKEFGVQVFKTSDHVTPAVVELTIGMTFTLSRQLQNHNQDMHQGVWKKRMGQFIRGKKVGIVGLGKIGSEVAKAFQIFGCEIIAFDPFKKEAQGGITLMSYEELLAQADIVTFHCNASDSNPIWTYDHAVKMKQGAILINCARGTLVCEESLMKALDEKILSGAGLDVYKVEPYEGKLSQYENILMTPHIGSYAKEARGEMEREAVLNFINSL